jgi:hypothetical protein
MGFTGSSMDALPTSATPPTFQAAANAHVAPNANMLIIATTATMILIRIIAALLLYVVSGIA